MSVNVHGQAGYLKVQQVITRMCVLQASRLALRGTCSTVVPSTGTVTCTPGNLKTYTRNDLKEVILCLNIILYRFTFTVLLHAKHVVYLLLLYK